MKNKSILALGLLSLVVGGCSSNEFRATQYENYQEKKLEEQIEEMEDRIDGLPKWVIEPRKADQKGIYSHGLANSRDYNLASKKATLEAEFAIAKRINQEISGSERIYQSDGVFSESSAFESVIDKLVKRVSVTGYEVVDTDYAVENGEYRVAVLLRISYEAMEAALRKEKEAADKGVLGTFRPKVTLIATAHASQGLQRCLNFHFARLIA